MLRSITKALLGATCACLFLTGCEPGPDASKIGALLPLTGDNASYGVDCRKGMELAVDEFNKASKTNFSLVVEDTQADPKTAVTAINKLISVDHVSAVAGDMFSNTTLAVAPLAQKNGVVLVTPTASLEDIVAVGDHIFSIYPSDRYEGQLDAKQALALGAKSIGVFQQQLQVFDTMGSAFKEAAVSGGARIAFHEVFPSGTKDFRNILNRNKGIPVDAIYVATYKTEAFALIKQVRETQPDLKIYSQSTLYDPQTLAALGKAGEGIVFSAPYYNDQSNTPTIDRFRAAYAAKYGSAPNVWAAYGHDVANLIMAGLQQAKEKGLPLKEIIAKSSFDGITGQTSFFPNRTANKTMQMFAIEHGAFMRLSDR